ncbi:MAG TPA: metal transporter [Clostridium sp.]|jgi:hypothetical protein|uniref:Potassium channel family protein n=1 Tax=Clostridium lapidicellarium TaxID=3240931 RepID=A0ABV4DU37_9CLOT|nr:potassium channel family protein [uncultured Clostridium sp.]NLU09295.1 two pore domain potassium channel family protein [Clostridiales bacterium]HBC97509.1 metal transporter [Clostridium sp.]
MKWFINVYKIKKKTILLFLALFYIIVLLCFGIVYWDIANRSNGEFFIFQDDINIDRKINMFERDLDIEMCSSELKNSIKSLLLSNEYKRPVAKLEFVDDSNPLVNVFSFEKVLGGEWANYYYLLFKNEGITHIAVENLGPNKISGRFDSYRIKVDFYKIDGNPKLKSFRIYTRSFSNDFKKVCTRYMWVNEYPVLYSGFPGNGYFYYPLNFYFPELVKNSISFLDDSPLVLKSVMNEKLRYPLWNFMYFSAVTMTTLGYGDIVPNSTIVRILVMIETITGVTIVGMFASCLFWNRG